MSLNVDREVNSFTEGTNFQKIMAEIMKLVEMLEDKKYIPFVNQWGMV